MDLRYRKFICTVAVVCCVTAFATDQNPASSPPAPKKEGTQARAAETEIVALERAWMAAWLNRDRALCERILADDFLLTSARGVLMGKNEWLDAAMESFRGEAFEWLEIRVRPFGDVAIVHAKARQRASVSGQDWSGLFLLTDVWVWRDDRWQVVSRHGTGPVKE